MWDSLNPTRNTERKQPPQKDTSVPERSHSEISLMSPSVIFVSSVVNNKDQQYGNTYSNHWHRDNSHEAQAA